MRVKQDKKGDEQDGAEGVEEAKEAEEEPTSSIPERPPGAAGNHFSNNGAGSISNQNVGNVINTTFIFSESARLPVISWRFFLSLGFAFMHVLGTLGRFLYV